MLGRGVCRVEEALLLRSYSADLTVLSLGRELAMTHPEHARLEEAGVQLVGTPVATLGLRGRSEPAIALGGERDEDGMLLVDDHQRTKRSPASTPSATWSRGSRTGVAMGQAAIAASAINSSLERVLRTCAV